MSEFSRPFTIGRLSAGAVEEKHAATAAERAALAMRLGLQGLDAFEASFRIAPRIDGLVVEGHIEADIIQECVVTLEPFASHLADDFRQIYLKGAADGPMDGEVELTPDEDEPEPLTGDSIDLGELAAQHLSLALDPYPRSPGAAVERTEFGTPEQGNGTGNPFSVLGGRRR